jgi:hypothetical protein
MASAILNASNAKRSPYAYDVMLSKKVLDNLKYTIQLNTDEKSEQECTWNVHIGDDTKNKWKIHTPILKVAYAAYHGIGTPKKGKATNYAERGYRGALLSDVDEDVATLDPKIAVSQKIFDDGMDELKNRIADAIWEEAKTKKNLQGLTKATDKVWKSAIELFLARHGNEEKYAKLAKDPKIMDNKKFVDAAKTNPEIESEAKERFRADMSYWIGEPDENAAAKRKRRAGLNMETEGAEQAPEKPEPKVYKLQTRVFWSPKEEEGKPKQGNLPPPQITLGNARQMPAKFAGGADASADQQQQVKKLDDAEADAPAQSSTDDFDYDQIVGGGYKRWQDVSDEEVKQVIVQMHKAGYQYTRVKYNDRNGRPLDLGPQAKNPNFSVINGGDYVQQEATLKVYSLKSGKFGIKLIMVPVVWLIRRGKKREYSSYTEESPAGEDIVLFPQVVPDAKKATSASGDSGADGGASDGQSQPVDPAMLPA